MSLRQLAAFGVVGAFSAAGVLGGSRWRRVELRRAELNKEYEELMAGSRTYNEECLSRDQRLTDKEQATKETAETLDILWTDRLERYAQVNKDLHAYLKALPEAIGAMKGLANHYRYMSEEMPKFIGFDIACSKVHNLALMLEHGRTVGVERVAPTLREMFAAEPLVQAVCDGICDAASAVPHPSSVAETGATFSFCMEELHHAVAEVTAGYAAALEEPPAPTPGPLSDGVRKVVAAARADVLSNGQRQLAERRKDLEKMLRRAQWQLHTEEDVRAAVEYTRQLDQHLASHSPATSHLSSASPAGKDEILAAIRSDTAVKNAMRQVDLWRDSATTFLVNHQAEDALQSYHILLAETLTKVNELK
ncbi:putative mitochondrial hypothetical protein [Leptomonas pyrrhocoris]|uniref:Uncharacterized protein n=1 Tax=Leptomonas pyrrhocoris TaxID=157538 RepID=A0A0M9FR81_LEPPY|nr:putative mitochondrial hypothetical protein [Leptomonas pyrrhocoris]XP_015652665.1 putative mitochondrial hypothetical protein [Leptomonas pyrrhocoris]KPA74225.1 putative mitochondrial hypothetical protein [Leptomonas pyrrhocoris]KPA74226.1 putative mitochondrial hypothetical protein [Leptomonas pyrrhocoris]|eukprot:XP_015652664.1 putative mitochondrial hypothetical protein [Leptomonas pyrrhocoris]